MTEFHQKVVVSVDPEPGVTCGYTSCTNSGIWLAKHLLDGAVESEYLVCADHIKYEIGQV